MTSTRALPREGVDTESGAGVLLARARELRRVADATEAELLAVARDWGHAHPGAGVVTEADWEELGAERSLPLAGPGTLPSSCSGPARRVVHRSGPADRRPPGVVQPPPVSIHTRPRRHPRRHPRAGRGAR